MSSTSWSELARERDGFPNGVAKFLCTELTGGITHDHAAAKDSPSIALRRRRDFGRELEDQRFLAGFAFLAGGTTMTGHVDFTSTSWVVLPTRRSYKAV